jgi:hypothetical protein
MEEKQFTLFVLSMAIGLTVMLGKCGPAPASLEVMPATPEKVVESFYNWYVGYPGNLLQVVAIQCLKESNTMNIKKQSSKLQ